MLFKKFIKNSLFLCLLWIIISGLNACGPAQLTKKDVEDLQAAAQQGNAAAQVLIGELYEFGADVPADPKAASHWYLQAAKANDPEAQYYLGILYDRGQGVPFNTTESMRRLFQSGEQGQQKAQILLAAFYLKNLELRQDFTSRIQQYKLKAEAGDAEAQYHLGWIYREGVGMPVNPHEALQWYHKSAAQQNAKAQLALGNIYLEGSIAPANPVRAMEFYRQSAKTKMQARIKLCELYQGADGIPKNEEEAKQCLEALNERIDDAQAAYIETQHAILNTTKDKNPERALRACFRISETDPLRRQTEDICTALQRQVNAKTAPPFEEAKSALQLRDWVRFRALLFRILTPDFNEAPVRRLITAAWQLIETEIREHVKSAEDALRPIETAEQSASFRRKHAKQIPEFIDIFTSTLERGLKAYPQDNQLLALAEKSRAMIASLQEKMKQPKPKKIKSKKTEKVEVDALEDIPEETDPAEDYFQKAQALFTKGQFGEAMNLFRKTTKVRGTHHIASAYIYMGLVYLAQVNPANIKEARKLRLRGLSCFQNALRFDGDIELPAGYNQYQEVFDEAKQRLH